jgi:hypothetical protein
LITTTPITIAGQDLITIGGVQQGVLSFVRKNIPPTQVSLFGDGYIAGRSIIVRRADGTTALCGQIIIP